MKIFGIKLKPFFRNTGASYTHRPAKRKKPEKVIDTKAIFADGVALGRMLAGEEHGTKKGTRRR